MAESAPEDRVPGFMDWTRGLPRQVRLAIDLIPQLRVCIEPHEFLEVLRKAVVGDKVEVSPDGWRREEVNLTPFTRTVTVKLDPASEHWIRQLSRVYGLSVSSVIRLGVFLLREFLEKGRVEG